MSPTRSQSQSQSGSPLANDSGPEGRGSCLKSNHSKLDLYFTIKSSTRKKSKSLKTSIQRWKKKGRIEEKRAQIQMHDSLFQLRRMHIIWTHHSGRAQSLSAHSPGTRTCRDPGAAQTLSAASTCWSRACAVSRIARRSCKAGPPTTGCASPGGGSRIFDSVDESQCRARYKRADELVPVHTDN